jgi:hypothetical protein
MKIILVLGMHRSGTSALAGSFSRLGFYPGKKLLAPNEYNARGYFEDAPLSHRLDFILKSFGRSWNDERLLPDGWLVSDSSASHVECLRKILLEEFDLNQPTVIKDPRICRLFPLLEFALQSIGVQLRCVVSVRSPFAVIESLERRDHIPSQRAALLYVAHLLEAEWHTRKHPRVFVQYEELLRDWRQNIGHVCETVGIDCVFPRKDDLAIDSEIDSFLSSDLNHFVPHGEAATGTAIDLAVEVHRLLTQPMDADVIGELDSVRERWHTYLASLEPWLSGSIESARLVEEWSISSDKPSGHALAAASANAWSEVFWATHGTEFSEQRKIGESWRYGERIEQRFVLPGISEPLTSLRWDITDRPAFCSIDRVWIEDAEGNTAWSWARDTVLFGVLSDDVHYLSVRDDGRLRLFASGVDPHGNVMIPSAVLLAMSQGWAFCTIWSARLPTQELAQLMREYSTYREAVASFEAALASVNAEIGAFRDQACEQATRLADLEKQRAQAVKQIACAEEQLSLLKELVMDDVMSDQL